MYTSQELANTTDHLTAYFFKLLCKAYEPFVLIPSLHLLDRTNAARKLIDSYSL